MKQRIIALAVMAAVIGLTSWGLVSDQLAVAQQQANLTRYLEDSALPGPTYVDVMYVGATTETYTVPASARWLKFSANKDFYVRWGDDAAVPTTEVADGTGSFLNPDVVLVPVGTTALGVIGAAADTIVTIGVYK